MFLWFCVLVFGSSAAAREVMTGQVMTGQPHQVPVNNSKVLTAARFAVSEFNRNNTEEKFAYKIVNITSAKVQLVAGINYILEVQLGRTVCSRQDTADTEDSEPCVLQDEAKGLQCHFIVTEIPWRNLRVLTQKKCHLPASGKCC